MRLLAKIIVGILLATIMPITTPMPTLRSLEVPGPRHSDFKDTQSPIVDIGYELYVVNGDGDGNFRPDDPITHAEFAQMCCNAFSPDPLSMNRRANPWYGPAFEWLYLQTIATAAPTLSNDSMRKLFEVYTDGRTEDTLQCCDNTYASYAHMITMLFIIEMANDDAVILGDVVDLAPRWAATTGSGYTENSPNWRKGSKEYITREEALHLILGLTGLIYDATSNSSIAKKL